MADARVAFIEKDYVRALALITEAEATDAAVAPEAALAREAITAAEASQPE